MKKLFRKRIVAYLVDVMIFALCYEMLRKYILVFVSVTGAWGYFLIVPPFFIFRDLLFKNASIGKKLLGLVVVDDKWSKPNFFTITKRAAITVTLGQVLYFKLKGQSESRDYARLAFAEWEYRHLKTRVVERHIFNTIKEKAAGNNGNADVDTMDLLYERYCYL